MIGFPGGCVVCDRPVFEGGKPNEHLTNVEVEWTNGSKMVVGVCKDCASRNAQATPEGKRAITAWHHVYWDRHAGRYDKEIVIA
jgi:hypothetical protein